MCAERRLLENYIHNAQQHGVPNHMIGWWIHRKTGGLMTIFRFKADGTIGCSVPCVFCRKIIITFRLKVQCVTSDGYWFRGYLDEIDAPQSKMTSGQKRLIH